MYKKLIKKLKQHLADWVLKDANVLIRTNNTIMRQDKYEVVDLNIQFSDVKLRKYFNEQVPDFTSEYSLNHSPFVDSVIKGELMKFPIEIIERKLFTIQKVEDVRNKSAQGYVITVKVLNQNY